MICNRPIFNDDRIHPRMPLPSRCDRSLTAYGNTCDRDRAGTREIDPGVDQVAHKRVKREAETVAELAAEYLERWAKLHGLMKL